MGLGIGIGGIGIGLGMGGPAPAFLPSNVSGLSLWLPSYRGIHVDTFQQTAKYTTVKRYDQSGSARHWTLGTSTQCLIWSPTAGVDGKPTLQTGTAFASSRYDSGPCGSLNTNSLSWFARIQFSSAINGTKTMYSCDNGNFEIDVDSLHTKFLPYYSSYYSPGAVYTPDQPIAIGVVSDGSGGTMYQDNGTTCGTHAASALAFSTFGTGNFINSPGFLVDALAGDLALFSTAVSAADVVRLMKYFNAPASWALGPLVVFDGNSLVSGTGSSAFNKKGPILAQDGLPVNWTGINLGLSGQTTSQMITRFGTVIAPLYDSRRSKNILCAWEIHNELYSGVDAATALANWATYVALGRAAGFKVYPKTVTPVTRAGVPADYESKRQTVNAAMRAGIPGIYGDKIIDVGASGNGIGSPGDSDGANYSDKEHFSDAGYAIEAAITATALLAA